MEKAAATYGRALRVIWGRLSAGHVSASINPVPSVCLLLFLQPPGSGSASGEHNEHHTATKFPLPEEGGQIWIIRPKVKY